MVKAFGAPHIEFSDKTNHEWHLECDGTPFSIYDWKEAFRPSNYPDELYEWHIGACSPGESYHMFLSVHHYMEDMDSNSDYEDRLEHLLGHFSDPNEAEHYANMDPANWPEGVPAMPSEPEFDSAGFSITDRMEKKQTALDLYVEQSQILQDKFDIGLISFLELCRQKVILLDQAKQMEKEQIEMACNQQEFEDIDGLGICETISKGQQYYNETYGGKDE